MSVYILNSPKYTGREATKAMLFGRPNHRQTRHFQARQRRIHGLSRTMLCKLPISGLIFRFWHINPFLEGAERTGRGCGGSLLHQHCFKSFLFSHIGVYAWRKLINLLGYCEERRLRLSKPIDSYFLNPIILQSWLIFLSSYLMA